MRISVLIICLLCFLCAEAQESFELKGEIDFPFFNYYSACGLNDTLAKQAIAVYERNEEKTKLKKQSNKDLKLFALVKKRGLLFHPYVIGTDKQEEQLIICMDSASYQKIGVWNYNWEGLTRNQQYLCFVGKGIWLGENAYWLTEFNQLALMEDKNRVLAGAKFARDVYRR